jgi:hypothetical protein
MYGRFKEVRYVNRRASGTTSNGERRSQTLIAALVLRRDALGHPLRRRLAHELVVEELLHAHRDVLLISPTRRVVDVVVVVDEVDLPAEAAHRDELGHGRRLRSTTPT